MSGYIDHHARALIGHDQCTLRGMYPRMHFPDPRLGWSERAELGLYLTIVVVCTLVAVQVIGLGLQLLHG